MAQNTLRASVELDDGGVTKKLNGISKAFDKIGGKGSGASLFGNVGAKAVAAGFNLISDAIGGTVGFLDDAVHAAIEDQASNERLNQALKNNVAGHQELSQAILDYIDVQGTRGFADDDVRDGLGQLVGVTHDVQKAQELLTIAEDLARAKGIDLATATDLVTKASQGNGKALKALGIDIGKTKDAATILDIVQQNVKGSADAWNQTMAGKLNKSQIAFNEAVEKIGYQLLPVLADIMQKFADDWLPALGRGWDKVTGAIKGFVDQIARGIEKVKQLAHWLDNIIPKINGISAGPTLPGLPLPHFAQGGWVGLHGPEMAIVGERGPEYIVPNNRLGGMGGGMIPHSHAIMMDGRRVAEAVDDRLAQTLRRAASTTARV